MHVSVCVEMPQQYAANAVLGNRVVANGSQRVVFDEVIIMQTKDISPNKLMTIFMIIAAIGLFILGYFTDGYKAIAGGILIFLSVIIHKKIKIGHLSAEHLFRNRLVALIILIVSSGLYYLLILFLSKILEQIMR